MTAISLVKINQLHRDFLQIVEKLQGLEARFTALVPNAEIWENPFRKYNVHINTDEVTKDLHAYLVRKFQETFCPNLNLEKAIPSTKTFDAVKLIEQLSTSVINQGDTAAYNRMLKKAQTALQYTAHTNKKGGDKLYFKLYPTRHKPESFHTSSGHIVHAKAEYIIAHDNIIDLRAIEQFVNFVIDYTSLASVRVPPSQYHTTLPLTKSCSNRPQVPIVLDIPSGPIVKFRCHKNGSAILYFRHSTELAVVLDALAGKFRPDFKRTQIDPEDMFYAAPDYERPRRIVKM